MVRTITVCVVCFDRGLHLNERHSSKHPNRPEKCLSRIIERSLSKSFCRDSPVNGFSLDQIDGIQLPIKLSGPGSHWVCRVLLLRSLTTRRLKLEPTQRNVNQDHRVRCKCQTLFLHQMFICSSSPCCAQISIHVPPWFTTLCE